MKFNKVIEFLIFYKMISDSSGFEVVGEIVFYGIPDEKMFS